jgi:hypothetical protein
LGGVCVIVLCLELGNLLFPLIELPVEHANLAEVAALEARELVAEVAECKLARGERCAQGGEVLAQAVELGFGCRGFAEDGSVLDGGSLLSV